MAKSNKNNHKIYLDYASSANPSSANPGAIHQLGVEEKNKLERARADVARILGAQSREIIFTSGATESNNLAILGIVNAAHIITTNIEHSSILEVCRHLENIKKAQVTYVPVEPSGIVDPEKIKKALREDTVLVSVMYANNEIGTIQPIQEIAKEIRHFNKTHSSKIFFHTDATVAVNYLPINVVKLGVDLLSFNGAKIYGPKGVGILYVKKNTPVGPIMFGGDQEFGLRPGTENVGGILELAEALSVVEKVKEKEVKRLRELQNYFLDKLKKIPLPFVLNGDLKNKLPNIINITIPKIPSDLLVIELSAYGIMTSAKSACKSDSGEGSYVIEALSPKKDGEIGGLRFSLGRETTKPKLDYTIKVLSQVLTKLKKWYN